MAIGTPIEPVPVTGLAPNFSPIPRIAPPPFGREMVGVPAWRWFSAGVLALGEESSVGAAITGPDRVTPGARRRKGVGLDAQEVGGTSCPPNQPVNPPAQKSTPARCPPDLGTESLTPVEPRQSRVESILPVAPCQNPVSTGLWARAGGRGGGIRMSEDPTYHEICNNIRVTDDIGFKLLGFV